LPDIPEHPHIDRHIAKLVLLGVENDDCRSDIGDVVAKLLARLLRLVACKRHGVGADFHDALALVQTHAAMGQSLRGEA
jgi:hypothetical protein